jgi:hypothetical protein
MDGQQVPNLEEMDERQARRFLEEMYTVLSAEKEYAARHDDYVMEMPQSGERIRGRENMRAFQESFPDYSNTPTIRVRRLLVRDGLWVGEGIIDYGEGTVLNSVAVVELQDGRIWRDTRYFAEPFEAPEGRSQWVEPMGPDLTPAHLGPATGEGPATTEQEIGQILDLQFAMMRAGGFDAAHEWYADGVIVEWRQSAERIRGKGNLLDLRRSYPADVRFELRRITVRRDLGVSEYVIRYDGSPVHVTAIAEFGAGKVIRETHYFADPFEAPGWRSQWVERIES